MLRLPTFLHPQALWWEMKIQDDKKKKTRPRASEGAGGDTARPHGVLADRGRVGFPRFLLPLCSPLPLSFFPITTSFLPQPTNIPPCPLGREKAAPLLVSFTNPWRPPPSPSSPSGPSPQGTAIILRESKSFFLSLSSLVPHLTKEKRKEHAAFPRLFGGCLRAPSLFQKCPHAPHPMDGDGQAPYEPRHHCPAQSPEEDLICVAPPPL